MYLTLILYLGIEMQLHFRFLVIKRKSQLNPGYRTRQPFALPETCSPKTSIDGMHLQPPQESWETPSNKLQTQILVSGQLLKGWEKVKMPKIDNRVIWHLIH